MTMTMRSSESNPDDIYMQEQTSGGPATVIHESSPAVMALPVSIYVSIGEAHLTMKDLLALTPDSILKLDAGAEDPVNLIIGDRIFATGELIEDGDNGLAVKVSSLID